MSQTSSHLLIVDSWGAIGRWISRELFGGGHLGSHLKVYISGQQSKGGHLGSHPKVYFWAAILRLISGQPSEGGHLGSHPRVDIRAAIRGYRGSSQTVDISDSGYMGRKNDINQLRFM